MDSSFQSQLDAIRKKRQAAFEQKQIAEEESRKAAADEEKLQQLLKRASAVAALPPIDRFAGRIGRFVRRVRIKFVGNINVNFAGESYSLEVADQMAQGSISPFDIPEAKSVVNAAIRKQQEVDAVITSSRDNCGDFQLLMMTAWMNMDDWTMEDKKFPECLLDLMQAMRVSEPERMMMRPFASKDEAEKNALAFWFRVFMHSQGNIPAWVGGTSEEWMARAEIALIEGLTAYNERQKKEQLRIMQQLDEIRELAEDDDVQCTNGNCDRYGLVRDMYRRAGGSFFFCRNCAPLVGIDVPPISSTNGDWNESSILPPMEGGLRTESPLSWGSDLNIEQDI